MATQLGGIYEGGEGIGAGLAQVFPKQQYEVPDVAGAYQKGMALAAKKKEAEDKAKQEKSDKYKERKETKYEGPTGTQGISRKNYELAKDYADKFRNSPTAVSGLPDPEVDEAYQKWQDYNQASKEVKGIADEAYKIHRGQGEIENVDILADYDSGALDKKYREKYKTLTPEKSGGLNEDLFVLANMQNDLSKVRKMKDWTEYKAGESSTVGTDITKEDIATKTTTTQKTFTKTPEQAIETFDSLYSTDKDFKTTLDKRAKSQLPQDATQEQTEAKAKEIYVNFNTGGKYVSTVKPTKDEDSYTYGGSVLETKNFKYDYSQDTISSDQSGELTGIIRNAAKNSDFYKNPKGLSQEELDAILNESIAGVLPYTTTKDVDIVTFVNKDPTQNKPLTLNYTEDGKTKTITGLPLYLESAKGENKYEIRVAYISEKGTNGDPDIWETKLVPYEG